MKSIVCIIVTWNKRELLLRNLERLLTKVCRPDNVRLDVLVVDNSSTDGSCEAVAERFPDTRIINTGGNLGGAGGFNIGLQIALDDGYDYVWAMDNDVLPSRGILLEYWDAMKKFDDRAMLGGTMNILEEPQSINESGATLDKWARIVLRFHRSRLGEVLREEPAHYDVDYVAFANVFFPAQLIRDAGLFPDFFIHYDDVDFCRRAKDAGYRIVNCLRAVYWHESYQAKPAILLRYYDIRNQLYVLEKRNGSRIRRSILNYLIDSAADLYRGRYLLTEMTLAGIMDFRKGREGRRDTDRKDFRTTNITAMKPQQMMDDYRVKHFVMSYSSYLRLFRPYRKEWKAFMATCPEDSFYMLVRKRVGRFSLVPLAKCDLSADGPLVEASDGVDSTAAIKIIREALLLTDDVTLNVKENITLHKFRKRLWLWGGTVIDYGRRSPAELLRVGARLLGTLLALPAPLAGRNGRTPGNPVPFGEVPGLNSEPTGSEQGSS